MTKAAKALSPGFWENNGGPIAVAHRGGDGAGIEKENSLKAFQAAYYRGFRWFETDVVPTKDGKLLAIHGRGLQRHPNKKLPTRTRLQMMSFEEVKKLLIGGEPVALMEDLLAAFPDVKWFIDPKVPAAVKPLIDVLKPKAVNLDNIVVGAFNQSRTLAVAEGVKTAAGRHIRTTIAPFGVCSYALLGASDAKIANLELRDRVLFNTLKYSRRLPEPRQAIAKTGAEMLGVPYRWLNESTNLVELAHDFGIHIVSWTADERADIDQSIQKGADAIMSNRLDILQEAILADDPLNKSIHH